MLRTRNRHPANASVTLLDLTQIITGTAPSKRTFSFSKRREREEQTRDSIQQLVSLVEKQEAAIQELTRKNEELSSDKINALRDEWSKKLQELTNSRRQQQTEEALGATIQKSGELEKQLANVQAAYQETVQILTDLRQQQCLVEQRSKLLEELAQTRRMHDEQLMKRNEDFGMYVMLLVGALAMIALCFLGMANLFRLS